MGLAGPRGQVVVERDLDQRAVSILIVDADPVARLATEAVLGEFNVIGSVGTGEDALRVAATAQPTVALIDMNLPGMGAATAARRLRDTLGNRIEIIAQASYSEILSIGDMVASGTAAYVVKGKFEDLVAAVRAVSVGSGLLSAEASRPLLEEVQRRYEAEHDRANQLEHSVARLEAMSITDWLTGLNNHGYFWDRLAEELQRARRYDRPFAIIMADIDDFKLVNDEFGHSVGDEVLRAVGSAFSQAVRDSDVACRVGGEEFGVIVPETGAVGAIQAAERIRAAVLSADVGVVGQVSVSLGISVFPFHSSQARELVDAADRALYAAKRAGKNRSRISGGPSGPDAEPSPMGPVVESLLSALELRAPELVAHSRRVASLGQMIGQEMEFSIIDLEQLRMACHVHDVGMIGVPDALLHKAGPLDEAEWAVVRTYPELSHRLIVGRVSEEVSEAVLMQHEWFEGSGYPMGAIGDDIPMLARVLHVADAFDAMQTPKPYRVAMTSDAALREIQNKAGVQFDKSVVRALERALVATESNVVQFPQAAG